MKAQAEQGRLIISFDERVDTNNSAEVEANIKRFIEANPGLTLEFDAENLQYISSFGLRILLRLRKSAGKNLVIRNVAREVAEIFEISGFTNFFDVHKKLRQISIENCPLVGAGASSKVYRIDAENVVKVYDLNVPLYKIEREINLAKRAFIAGLPTAISYDLVKVGNALQADNCANFSEIMKKFLTLTASPR